MQASMASPEILSARLSCEEDRGPPLLILAWTLLAVAIVTVALRIRFRRGLRNGISWDDYFIVASLVSTCASKLCSPKSLMIDRSMP
jgi:hypothetical protein